MTYSQKLSNLSPRLAEMEPLLLPVKLDSSDEETNMNKWTCANISYTCNIESIIVDVQWLQSNCWSAVKLLQCNVQWHMQCIDVGALICHIFRELQLRCLFDGCSCLFVAWVMTQCQDEFRILSGRTQILKVAKWCWKLWCWKLWKIYAGQQQLTICTYMWELPDYSRPDHLSRFDPLHHRMPRILPELGIYHNQNQSKKIGTPDTLAFADADYNTNSNGQIGHMLCWLQANGKADIKRW